MKVASISMKISEAMCWSVRTLRDPTQLPTHMNYEARTRSVKVLTAMSVQFEKLALIPSLEVIHILAKNKFLRLLPKIEHELCIPIPNQDAHLLLSAHSTKGQKFRDSPF